jgi:ABC-type sugar transport system substrate-binding protein
VGQYYGVSGGLSAQYLASKLKGAPGKKGKIVMYHDRRLELAKLKFSVAKSILNHFGIPVVTEVDVGSSEGNPSVWSKEQMKNLLLADTNKEIKGVWTYWEGAGIPAAEACAELGRSDIVVVTCEDSPRTYEMIRTLPTLHGTSGGNRIFLESSVKKLFMLFGDIFAGKPTEDQQLIEAIPYLVTKENLPPKGYFYNPAVKKYTGPPDFAIK